VINRLQTGQGVWRTGARPLASSPVGSSLVEPRYPWFEHCFVQGRAAEDVCLPDPSGKSETVRLTIGRRTLHCQLGELTLASLPLRVAQLFDYTGLPNDEAGYDRLFAYLSTRKLDGVYLQSVGVESFAWNYLNRSPRIRDSYRVYSPQGPRPHWLVRIRGEFESYLQRLSPKTRKNRLREIRMLRKRGDLRLIRVQETPEVEGFLRVAYAISQKTKKFRRFGWGVAARDPVLLRQELQRLARSGYLRSYLLTCDTTPCAFVLGEQSDSRFRPVAAGVDPAWKSESAGSVLLMLVLEDLFKENSPEFYDLGSSAEYLATDCYFESETWLFCRAYYPTLVSGIFRLCNASSMLVANTLRRVGWKEKVTRLIRTIDR
jgi:hypothetical protein